MLVEGVGIAVRELMALLQLQLQVVVLLLEGRERVEVWRLLHHMVHLN